MLPTARECHARRLGAVPYAQGLEIQADLVRRRAAGEVPDQLLLLEHPHVLTLGRDSKAGHVLADAAHLQALGVELFDTGRGGDVTYHGPGQLVAYPILNLTPDRCDLHRYVRDLERVLVATIAEFGIMGHAVPGHTGVWVERVGMPAAKIAAIGVRVARWISSHGVALNVHTDLSYFGLIVPCGLQDSAVTSIVEQSPAPVSMAAVAEHFAVHFGTVFERRMIWDAGPVVPTGPTNSEAAR